jgi:hypothetical protein
MNKRIQALLAKFKETESTHRGAHVLIGIDEIEKFAELIVAECANVAAEQSAFKPEYRIRKHFGVEE